MSEKQKSTDAWTDSKGKVITLNDCIRACRQGGMALVAKTEFDEKIKGTPLADDFRRYAEILEKIKAMYAQAAVAQYQQARKKAKPKLEIPHDH